MSNQRYTSRNSRLFIIAGKGISEDEYHKCFGKYGTIQDVYIVKDRQTSEEKGIVYIKFSKTSSAFLAMEEMNGKCVPGHPKPLKVLVASSKRDGSVRDPREEERLVRLFVIVPKSYSEDDVRKEFEKFGDIEDVTILKDRKSGFGYVKYHRPYHAALAYESCDAGIPELVGLKEDKTLEVTGNAVINRKEGINLYFCSKDSF